MTLLERYDKYFKWIALAVVLGLIVLAISIVVTSLPPRSFTLLTGRPGGGYYLAALDYQRIAQERGFDLQIQTTSGSVETLQLLEEGRASIGFVQGGVAADADPAILSTMASVFYEPVWIFYNRELENGAPLVHLHQLEGLRLAVGEAHSGARKLTDTLLTENDVTAGNSTLLELPSDEAAAGLQDGSIDAALFVVAPTAEVIQSLLRDPNLKLMNVERAEAYSRKFPYLAAVTLPEGAIDTRLGIPAEDTLLIASVANLIVHNDFHPDLLRLMTIAAVETHERGGLLEERFEFPNFRHADLPINREELAYMERIKSGESTLDNYLPFWAAALIERYLLFILPIAILLLPLISRSPLLVSAYNRHKITRWYSIVRDMDRNIPHMDIATIDNSLRALDDIEQQLQEHVSVPVGFMSEYYDLRSHIDLVQARLEKRRAQLTEQPAAETPSSHL